MLPGAGGGPMLFMEIVLGWILISILVAIFVVLTLGAPKD